MIDDDHDDAHLFAIALRHVDPSCTFTHASDGTSGLQLLKPGCTLPDFIFLDLNMPRMHGKECLREIRKQAHLTDVPVIIHTTSRSPRDVTETKALGASYFVTKPMTMAEVEEMIRFIITERHPTGIYLREAVEVF